MYTFQPALQLTLDIGAKHELPKVSEQLHRITAAAVVPPRKALLGGHSSAFARTHDPGSAMDDDQRWQRHELHNSKLVVPIEVKHDMPSI